MVMASLCHDIGIKGRRKWSTDIGWIIFCNQSALAIYHSDRYLKSRSNDISHTAVE